MATTNAQTFTIGGVTHQVEDTTARAGVASLQTALASLQSALDTLMGTDDITDEIDTYNEIKEFLDGFDTDDPNLSEQLTTLFTNVNDLVAAMPNKASATQVSNLQTAVTNLQTALAGKVDAVNGKGLSTNDFTTALLNKLNGIAAGAQVNVINGIKAHGASTNLPVTNGVVELPEQTEVDPDDYYDKDEVDELIENIPAGPQGPKGDTVVVDTEGLEQFGLANTLDSTSTTDGLTARQGKILKQAIMTVASNLQAVYNALAGVAFVSLPKPTLTPIDWTGGTFYVSISKSLTGVTDTNDAVQVAENASYTNTLTPQSGLTMKSVVVTMGGVDITSTAYTAATGVISIAQVTGSIVITALAEMVVTYNVRNHLLNMSSSNAATTIEKGDTFTAQITPDSGCTSNNDLKVLIGGVVATLGTDYTFADGTLEIEDVAGDIDIIASAYTDVITFKTTATGTTTLKLTGGGTDWNSSPMTTLVNGDAHTPDANGVFTLSAGDTISFVGHDINTITIGDKTAIKSIDFGGASVSLNSGNLGSFTNLESIEGVVFRPHRNNALGLGSLFLNNTSIESIDVSHYALYAATHLTNPAIAVTQTSLSGTVKGCSALKHFKCSVDTQSITTLEAIFSGCTNLETVEFIYPMTQITSIKQMFMGASSNITLKISDFNLSQVTNSSDAFTNKVKTLICTTATPPDNSLLTYMTGLTAIYVPADAVSAYKTAWPSKENIIHPVTDYTE